MFNLPNLTCITLLCRFKNGREIRPDNRYTMSYVEDSASLTIISPDINDSADYMCTAGNKLGSVDTEASLTVQSESE